MRKTIEYLAITTGMTIEELENKKNIKCVRPSEALESIEFLLNKYLKCISVIKKFDAGIIGMYDL